jgi:hypothetical protein
MNGPRPGSAGFTSACLKLGASSGAGVVSIAHCARIADAFCRLDVSQESGSYLLREFVFDMRQQTRARSGIARTRCRPSLRGCRSRNGWSKESDLLRRQCLQADRSCRSIRSAPRRNTHGIACNRTALYAAGSSGRARLAQPEQILTLIQWVTSRMAGAGGYEPRPK